ncbi:hypothetical protein PVAP13_3KG329527 [Panicum virgatum]|uniref:Uncharacterized protein n=1 Tax=Panicum virgatum TaxID=38727 RepID=A0A8T0UYD4_PANVG|nr:hypothetical protein PVAP13_3KG329527 [Panicum virgatum]
MSACAEHELQGISPLARRHATIRRYWLCNASTSDQTLFTSDNCRDQLDYLAGVFIHYNGSKKLSYPSGPNRSRKHLNSSSGHGQHIQLYSNMYSTSHGAWGGLCIFKAVWMEYPLCYYYMKTMRSQTY